MIERALRQFSRPQPGGPFALALRIRRDDVGRYDRSHFGMTDSDLEELQALLEAVGFRDLRVERREIHSEHMAALLTQRGT